MSKRSHPRRGSLGYYPRKRAKRIYPRVRVRPQTKELKIQEFAGYKVGMTHISMINDKKGSPTHNQEIIVPVTILETPPLKVCGIRAYQSTLGIKRVFTEILTKDLDKELERKIKLPKKEKDSKKIEENLEKISDISLIIHTQPKKAGIRKKKPELFEIGISGENLGEKWGFAKEKLGKEISINDVFEIGTFIDAIGITKGKGFQGSVKRFGVRILSKKARKVRRKAGTLGPWHPAKTRWTVPQMGQMGFHKRTEYNKRLILIGKDAKEINKNGWRSYGLVKDDYVLLKGSIQGPSKRLIRLRSAIRAPKNNIAVPVIGKIVLK